MKRGQRVLVIGGGIGGLAAAIALRKVGLAVSVFERAPEIREVGAGLTLWSNAVHALRCFDLEARLLPLSSPIERTLTRTAAGKLLNESMIGALSRKCGAASVVIHRAELQRTLMQALDPADLHTSCTCIGFAADTDGVTARFADSREERGDLLVGADGINSAIRSQLFGASPPRYAGYTAWRGMASFQSLDLPEGEGVFALGQGTQIGIFHCGPGRIYWFVTRNGPAGQSDPPGGHKQAARHVFRNWFPLIPAVIEATEETAIFRNDIIDRLPAWPWGAGRVTLLGDAIHPTTPNLGQGACQAIEDAVILADALRRATSVEAGLRAYEERRQQRTGMITKQSWSLGKIFQMQNPLLIPIRNFIFSTRLGQRQGERLFDELLSYKVPALSGGED